MRTLLYVGCMYYIGRAFVISLGSHQMYVPVYYIRLLPAIISWCLWERQYGGTTSGYRGLWSVRLGSEGIWGPWQWLVSGYSSRSGMDMLSVRG